MSQIRTKPYLSVVLPAFNEELTIQKCIKRLVAELEKFTDNYEIIVVNDGSTDDTRKLLVGLKTQYRYLKLISYKTNKGKGHAIRRGLEKASGELFVIMDADLEIDPCQIKEYVKKLEDAIEDDFKTAGVIGCKFDKNSKVDFPKYRRIMSLAYYGMLRAMFRFDVKDTQTGLKCFNGQMIRKVLPKLSVEGFAYDVELLTAVVRNGGKIIQAPIICEYGREVNRMSINHVLKTFEDTVRIFLSDKKGKYT